MGRKAEGIVLLKDSDETEQRIQWDNSMVQSSALVIFVTPTIPNDFQPFSTCPKSFQQSLTAPDNSPQLLTTPTIRYTYNTLRIMSDSVSLHKP